MLKPLTHKIYSHFKLKHLQELRPTVEAKLLEHFKDTPWNSFELQSENYKGIKILNNKKLEFNFFSTNLIRKEDEHVAYFLTHQGGTMESFLFENNMKQADLLLFYYKFNDNLRDILGEIFKCSQDIKYSNGKLSFSFNGKKYD